MLRQFGNLLILSLTIGLINCNQGSSKRTLTLAAEFVIELDDTTSSRGMARLDSSSLIFQFEKPAYVEVQEVDFLINKKKFRKEIRWICGLLKDDLRIVHCSTGRQIFEEDKFFVDHGFYNVAFRFNEDIELPQDQTIDLILDTNKGEKTVTIEMKPRVVN